MKNTHTKKPILFLLFMLTALTLLGQNFEGKLLYKNTFKSKNQKVTDEQWTSMMGTMNEYFIKNGDYKSISNGTLIQWQLYNNNDNKIYNKFSNSPTIFWNDASINADSVLEAKINKNVEEILGYKCDELIMTCKSGVQKYYFNSSLSVDINFFTKHKFGNWFDYLSKAHALPLKSIIENDQFTMETTVTEVQSIKLDSKLFDLPHDVKTEKSPY